MQFTESIFGQLDDGRDVYLYTLSNRDGVQVQITNYGAIIVSLKTPGKGGSPENIVLGFDTLQDYLGEHPYFGALIGRYANRIANGRFILDGIEYHLAINDGENHLHGGEKGFDKVLWDGKSAENRLLRLTYVSRDGEEGYPGTLKTVVTYGLTSDNELHISYEATTDRATPVNLTSHSYFNLTGNFSKTILNHRLKLHATYYTPVNSQLIPKGEIVNVEGTPFDFSESRPVGARIGQVEGGYDHNFLLEGVPGRLKTAAELRDPESGRKLVVYTTEPAVQFYSGNFLDGSLTGRDGSSLMRHAGLCLEPQRFPNAPNEPGFPSAILRPQEIYRSRTVYAFSVE